MHAWIDNRIVSLEPSQRNEPYFSDSTINFTESVSHKSNNSARRRCTLSSIIDSEKATQISY